MEDTSNDQSMWSEAVMREVDLQQLKVTGGCAKVNKAAHKEVQEDSQQFGGVHKESAHKKH